MAKVLRADAVRKVLKIASSLPYCKIKRAQFLKQTLTRKVSARQLNNAIQHGTVNAGIPVKILDRIAFDAIADETRKATLLSAAAGIAGAPAIIASAPADLVQYYGHVFRIVQKLAYTYGDTEINLHDGMENRLMLYLGVMFGVRAASAALIKLAANNLVLGIGAKVAAKPLAATTTYKIARIVLGWVGVKLGKDAAGKTASKTIPLLGSLLSGGLTYATFRPMALRLQKELSRNAAMAPEELAAASVRADAELRKLDTGIVRRLVKPLGLGAKANLQANG